MTGKAVIADNHGSLSEKRPIDPRKTRTRRALLDAFNRLVLVHRRRKIRVSDIIEEAGVGRSTFYEHFGNADAVRREALSAPFAPLADAAVGKGDEKPLCWLLEHFWENRQRARTYFSGRSGEDAQRLLAQMVEARLNGGRLTIPARLAAHQLSAAAFAPVRTWLLGEAPSTTAELAASLCRTGKGLMAALQEG